MITCPSLFNPRELLARIKAILRRRQIVDSAPQEDMIFSSSSSIVYSFCGWTLHYATRQLLSPDNTEVSLSGGEFDLLFALVTHPNHVLSRDQLLDLTKNRQAGPFDRSIDIQISRLRRKIDDDSKKPSVIKTVRGGGYIFTCTVKKLSIKHNEKTVFRRNLC
ncbi:MAG: winged helix-turn-helix domain-containing protein [Gammaproteobacteria bacterium]|nr:winged helix-turn-helix domain-containing protein [Gammaproteobacteria bacterium]